MPNKEIKNKKSQEILCLRMTQKTKITRDPMPYNRENPKRPYAYNETKTNNPKRPYTQNPRNHMPYNGAKNKNPARPYADN